MGKDIFNESGFEFGASLADGAIWPRYLTGRELIELLFGEKVHPSVRSLTLKARTVDGKTVKVTFGNDDTEIVRAEIE